MATSKKSTSGQTAKRAPVNTALRKQQQALDGERLSRHQCTACGQGIQIKDLQMVICGQPGGHKVKQPHHKKCCF